jgi:protein-disulfide isomerase
LDLDGRFPLRKNSFHERGHKVKALQQACLAVITATLLLSVAPVTAAQTQSTSTGEIQKKVENYLRELYAFGPDVKLVVSTPKDTGIPGLAETTVDLTMGETHDSAKMYVSKDGKYLLRGEMADLSKDPLADTRAKIELQNAPALGSPTAPVTIVEFADFECPVCRQLHDVMRGLLPNYPQVRLIFKDYPIEQIHPWAKTAALAGRCAYQQDPKAFWKMYDSLYDNQDVISAENAWTKMVDYAGQAGLDQNAFKACLASPEAAAAVDANVANGKALEVSSTPTLFVNGRRIVGADAKTIEQYIRYELNHQKSNP